MVHLNPVTVWLDVPTLVWINAFMLNLQKSVQSLQVGQTAFSKETFFLLKKLVGVHYANVWWGSLNGYMLPYEYENCT